MYRELGSRPRPRRTKTGRRRVENHWLGESLGPEVRAGRGWGLWEVAI